MEWFTLEQLLFQIFLPDASCSSCVTVDVQYVSTYPSKEPPLVELKAQHLPRSVLLWAESELVSKFTPGRAQLFLLLWRILFALLVQVSEDYFSTWYSWRPARQGANRYLLAMKRLVILFVGLLRGGHSVWLGRVAEDSGRSLLTSWRTSSNRSRYSSCQRRGK